MNKFISYVASVSMLALTSCGTADYKDPSLSAEVRTEALLKQMTLEEKIGQVICPLGWPMYEKISEDSVTVSEKYKDFIGNQHGGMLWGVFRADPWTRKTLENGLSPRLAAFGYSCNPCGRSPARAHGNRRNSVPDKYRNGIRVGYHTHKESRKCDCRGTSCTGSPHRIWSCH